MDYECDREIFTVKRSTFLVVKNILHEILLGRSLTSSNNYTPKKYEFLKTF